MGVSQLLFSQVFFFFFQFFSKASSVTRSQRKKSVCTLSSRTEIWLFFIAKYLVLSHLSFCLTKLPLSMVNPDYSILCSKIWLNFPVFLTISTRSSHQQKIPSFHKKSLNSDASITSNYTQKNIYIFIYNNNKTLSTLTMWRNPSEDFSLFAFVKWNLV